MNNTFKILLFISFTFLLGFSYLIGNLTSGDRIGYLGDKIQLVERMYKNYKRPMGKNLDRKLQDTVTRNQTYKNNLPEKSIKILDSEMILPMDKHLSNEHAFKQEMLLYKSQMQLQHHCTIPTASHNANMQAFQDGGGQEVYKNCTRPRVPNIVHFVWLWDKPETYKFRQLLGGLSVLRILKPCAVIFWNAGFLPTGPYWDEFTGNVTSSNETLFFTPNITTPQRIGGKNVKFEAHKSDIVRVYAIKYFGGIYLDFDVIALKPFTPLLCYDMTMGREMVNGVPNNFMISVPNATFINVWLDHYEHNYHPDIWGEDSVLFPNRMIRTNFSNLIHVEESSINRPNWAELDLIFKGHFDWTTHYAMHLWNHMPESKRRIPYETPENILHMNSSFGEIARYIYYRS